MRTHTFALGLVVIAGCLKANPNFLSPDGNTGTDSGSGSDGSGSGSSCSCTAEAPVCDTMTNMCGPCRSDADCGGATPTCLPSGACDGDADLAYVTATGSDANACTIEMPCATVTHAMTVKTTVVLTGTANDDGVSLTQGSDVTILGRGSAMITRNATLGAAVSISDGSLKLYDVTLTGAGTTQGDGIASSTSGTVDLEHVGLVFNPHYGINATAGKIIARRAEIANNGGGGVWLNSAGFDIENCLIYSNGVTGTSSFGGIDVMAAPTPAETIQFTTIADNHAIGTEVGGVVCSGQAVTLGNNIIYDNDAVSSFQTFGTCAFTYTDFYPAASMQSGSGNASGDPMFVSTTDFHIGASSAAKDAADPSASLKVDFYGDPRPAGSGYDMGADELQ